MGLRDAFGLYAGLRATISAMTLLLVATPLALSAQVKKTPTAHITVLVINPRSGKPLKRAFVSMGMWIGKTDVDTPATSIGKTDSKGEATFQVPQSTPWHISFSLSPPDHEFCSTLEFSTDEVLRAGTVATYDATCGKLKWHGSVNPGEVVIFVRKLNVWQQMLLEIP